VSGAKKVAASVPLAASSVCRSTRTAASSLRVARHTEKWKKAYRRRTSVERVNSRIDRVLGFEVHFIRGMAKMKARVTTGLAVMLAMALGRIRADQKDRMRSLLAPVRIAS
jgi:uncharacterized protein YcbX